MPLETAAIHSTLRARAGDAVGELVGAGERASLTVAPDALVDVCRHLRDDIALDFDCLSSLSGVDYPKREVIQVVYHFFSYRQRHTFVVKVDVPRDDPRVPTLTPLWSSADWMEREVFDLLGVVFDGHPDLRRILMPEDWPGHPLRKDFVEPETYHGISTSRASLLKA